MTDTLLLFYSINCGHSRMLLDSIGRYDTKKLVKSVCVESLMSENKLPPQIHSVPAMMVISEKKFLYGKHVFDYLLLPGSGKLVGNQDGQSQMPQSQTPQSQTPQSQTPQNTANMNDEPMGFSISLNGMSDCYSLIDSTDENMVNNDRQYNWTHIEGTTDTVTEQSFNSINQDVRSKKELPSLADLQELRSLDLNKPETNNPNNMPNAISSR